MDEEGNQTPQDPAPQAPDATPAPPSEPAPASEPAGPAFTGSLPAAPPPSQWSFPPASGTGSAPAGSKPANANAGYLVIAGGIVVVVSLLLPWEKASFLGHSVSGNGFKVSTWFWLIVLGGFAIARGAALINPSIKFRAGSPWISVALIAIALVWSWVQIHDDINHAKSIANGAGFGSSLSTSIGIGFWLAVVGLLLVAAGAFLSTTNN